MRSMHQQLGILETI